MKNDLDLFKKVEVKQIFTVTGGVADGAKYVTATLPEVTVTPSGAGPDSSGECCDYVYDV